MKSIRQALNNWLVKLAFKILDRNNIRYVVPVSDTTQQIVDGLVKQVQEKFGDQTGEFKRHQVLRAATNAMPDVPERTIALAIEYAIQHNV